MQATAHGDNIAVSPHPLKAMLYSIRLGIRHPEDLEGKCVRMNRGYMFTGGVRPERAARCHHGHEHDHRHDSDMRRIALIAPHPMDTNLNRFITTQRALIAHSKPLLPTGFAACAANVF